MTAKKILGIILAVLFGGIFAIGLFTLVFYVLTSRGYAIWFSALIGFAPFVGVALIVGMLALIFYLLEDSDQKSSKGNGSRNNRNSKR